MSNGTSMCPEYGPKSLNIFERVTHRDQIKVGEVYVFRGERKGRYKFIHHRIVGQYDEHEDIYYFWGDNNQFSDGTVLDEQIIERSVWHWNVVECAPEQIVDAPTLKRKSYKPPT